MSVFRPEDFNCPPVGQDCSQSFIDALAAIDATGSGGTLRLSSRVYDIPDGITESVKGLSVEGEGNGDFGPSSIGNYGSIIRTTNPGAIAWHHTNSSPTFNVYQGLRIQNISLLGNPEALGGLLLNTNHNSIYNVRALMFKGQNAFGFKNDIIEGQLNDDASWNTYFDCRAGECWDGFVLTGQDAGSELIGCITLKTTQGGIGNLGVGMRVEVGNVSICGGKNESNEIGLLVTSSSGVTVSSLRAEGNRIGYKLYRMPGYSHGSRILLSACQASSSSDYSLWIGPHNSNDRISSFASPSGNVADLSGKALFSLSDMQNIEQGLGSEELSPEDLILFNQKKS